MIARTAAQSQLRARVRRVEIAVLGDLLGEPMVHECSVDKLTLAEHGIEIVHQDSRGYQLVPWGRVVRIDYRLGDDDE